MKTAHKAMAFISAVLVAGAMALPAMAQDAPGANPAANPAPVRNFDRFLDHHPGFAKQLANNPGLVDDPQFMASHPGLQKYFANHPGVKDELKAHPYRFMGREGQYGNREGGHPLANTDRYLDRHPEVAQQLSKNPALIDNQQYLQNHPGLHAFLKNHPEARAEWKSHPYRYAAHERRWDARHDNGTGNTNGN